MCTKYKELLQNKDKYIPTYQIPDIRVGHLTKEYFQKNGFRQPLVIEGNLEDLELQVPSKDCTMSDIAQRVGSNYPIKVIEVGRQLQHEGWTIGQYAKYERLTC